MDVANPEHAFVFQPRRRTLMKKLTLAFALLLSVSAAAHAQAPNGSPGFDPQREALRDRNTIRLDEAHINASRTSSARLESEADAVRHGRLPSFKAQVKVTNHASKTIMAVEWTATLIDPDTRAVIRSYDVTNETKIAPGKTKKLSKYLQTPRTRVVSVKSATPGRPAVADLKVKVTGVTYADGTTSTTP
jgi:hypothetical protein